MLFGQKEWSYLIRFACFKTCFEAEEDDRSSDDVEQEREADPESCQEHRANGVRASKTWKLQYLDMDLLCTNSRCNGIITVS